MRLLIFAIMLTFAVLISGCVSTQQPPEPEQINTTAEPRYAHDLDQAVADLGEIESL